MNEEILMKQSKYSETQIMGILKQAESGVPVCLTSALVGPKAVFAQRVFVAHRSH